MKKKLIEKLEQCSTDRSHHKTSSGDYNYALHQRLKSIGQGDKSYNKCTSSIIQKKNEILTDSIRDLAQTLSKASFNEIQQIQIKRENEKLKNENSQFKSQQIKLYSVISTLNKQIDDLIEKIKYLEHEHNIQNKKIITEQKLNEELQKKIKRFEQRIQIILESNIIFQKDQIKNTLIDTMHENEHYKMEAIQKEKELQKLQVNNNNLNHKLNRLTNRQIPQRQQTESEFIDQEKMVITFTKIPNSFMFRHIFQNQECKSFLSTSIEQTPEQFSSHFNLIPQDQKKLHLTWIFTHLVNYREFCQQHNNLIHKLKELSLIKFQNNINVRSYNELYKFAINLAYFLKVQKVTLWLRECSTGFFETLIEGEQVKIMCVKGAFKDCLDQKESINKLTAQRYIMYQNSNGEDIMQESTYLYPLLTDSAFPGGILEIYHPNQSNSFSDLQYFTSIIGSFITLQLDRIEEEQMKLSQIAYKDIIVIEFLKLMKAKDKEHFSILVKNAQQTLLQISTCDIIYIEGNKMWKYGKELKEISYITGICGAVAKEQKAAFYSNICKQINFNQLIDIYTICPIFVFPIINQNKETKAVIEITLTNKQIDKYRFKDTLANLNSQSNQVKIFCDCIKTAYLCKFE